MIPTNRPYVSRVPSRPGAAPLVEDLTAPDGTRLTTYEWRPDTSYDPGRPRALVLYAHGYGEHAGRHVLPITELAAAGYLVCALDHRGHGRSDGPRATCERFDDFTDDYAALVRRTRSRYPEAPLFALGYSMGSLVALRYALSREGSRALSGLIVAGCALHPIPRVPGWARPAVKSLVRRVAHVAPTLPVTPPCESRCRPGADDLCYSGPTPARMASELLAAGDDAAARAHELAMPLLILHGARDRVTGIEGARKLNETAASHDKTLALFEHLAHPVLTPPDRGVPARARLLRWLDARTARAGLPERSAA